MERVKMHWWLVGLVMIGLLFNNYYLVEAMPEEMPEALSNKGFGEPRRMLHGFQTKRTLPPPSNPWHRGCNPITRCRIGPPPKWT